MKTITCVTPGVFSNTDEPMPERKAGEALVRIRRIGICGTDIHAFAGRQPFFNYPRVLGHELSGEICEIDGNDMGLQPGDPVTIVPYLGCGTCVACRNGRPNCCTDINVLGVHSDGGMREYVSVPIDSLIKNSTLSYDQLAMVECFSIGAHAARRAQIRKGEKVLIVGAGPIGLGLIQFARLLGGDVIVMDISDGRLAVARDKLGVEHLIHAAKEDPGTRLAELTNGDFPTVIFDCTGNPKSMMAGFHYLAHGGRYVLVSLVTADISFPDPEFHKRETTLLSSRNATKADFEWVIESIEDGKVVVEPLITHHCHFDQMVDQFDAWGKPDSGVIKVIVEM